MEIKKWEDGELFEANGGHMYWVFWPGNESNGVTLHYTYLLPGESFNLHNHDYSEDIITVIKGEGKVLTDKEELDIEEGMSLRAKAREFHGFKNTGEEPMVLIGSQAPADLNIYKKGGYTFIKK